MQNEDTAEGRLAAAVDGFLRQDRSCHTCGETVADADHGVVCTRCGKTLFRPGQGDWKEYLLPFVLFELLNVQSNEASRALQRNSAEQAAHAEKLRQALEIVRKRIAEMGKL